jgi:hypothetical protein
MMSVRFVSLAAMAAVACSTPVLAATLTPPTPGTYLLEAVVNGTVGSLPPCLGIGQTVRGTELIPSKGPIVIKTVNGPALEQCTQVNTGFPAYTFTNTCSSFNADTQQTSGPYQQSGSGTVIFSDGTTLVAQVTQYVGNICAFKARATLLKVSP